jgi:hypothetical protein
LSDNLPGGISLFALLNSVRLPRSAFDCPLAGFSDHDLADLDRLGASLDHPISYRHEPGENQAVQHPVCEAVSKHQRFGGAMLVDEQF